MCLSVIPSISFYLSNFPSPPICLFIFCTYLLVYFYFCLSMILSIHPATVQSLPTSHPSFYLSNDLFIIWSVHRSMSICLALYLSLSLRLPAFPCLICLSAFLFVYLITFLCVWLCTTYICLSGSPSFHVCPSIHPSISLRLILHRVPSPFTHHPFCLSAYPAFKSFNLFLYPFLNLTVRPSFCASICLPIRLSIRRSTHLSICLLISPSSNRSVSLPICLAVSCIRLSVHLPNCLSLRVSLSH